MCIVFVLHGFYCTDVSTYPLSCIFKSCFLLNFRPDDDLNLNTDRNILLKDKNHCWLFVLCNNFCATMFLPNRIKMLIIVSKLCLIVTFKLNK